MKKLCVIFSILFLLQTQATAAIYTKIEPQYLNQNQSQNFESVNETVKNVFGKIRTKIKTKKYPKYYVDYKLIENDGTQNQAYKYVKFEDAELMYSIDTNELKYISFKREEPQKCRIMYSYPAGNLQAVQIFTSGNESFVFSADGKYIDYTPYVKEVHQKVKQNWKVPNRKVVEKLAKGQKDLLVQIALIINKDGTVKNTLILKSSKIKTLDDNAIHAIKNAAPFKSFPEDFFNDELTIILNFNFSL